MNKIEHLLACLTEECAEVQKATAKALRFGVNDVHPSTNQTNSSEIYEEIIHVVAIAEMLAEKGVIPADFAKRTDLIQSKKGKVRKWMEHAIENGTLEKEEDNSPEKVVYGEHITKYGVSDESRIVKYIKDGGD